MQSADDIHERGLAGAVETDQSEDTVLRQRKIQPLEHLGFRHIPALQIPEFKQCTHRAAHAFLDSVNAL